MIAALFADTNIKLTIILMVIACLLPFVCAALAKYLGGYNIKTIKHLVSFWQILTEPPQDSITLRPIALKVCQFS